MQKRGHADSWGAIINPDDANYYKGKNIMGRLLMQLRDSGKLKYDIPKNILDFIINLK